MQNNKVIDKNSREYQVNLYNSSRGNLIAVVLFTVLNLVLLLAGSDSYMLFSASIPYYMTAFGYVFDRGAIGTFTTIALGISVVILGVYLLCWILSKKRRGWLTVATVFFALDTVCMLGLMVFMELGVEDMLLDIVFHGWVMISLIRGCMAATKLKTMPEEPEVPEVPTYTGPDLDPV